MGKFLIGQDTELFLRQGDDFVSAHGVIPGSKTNPYPVKKGAVQVDGMALEFNTAPAKTANAFIININTVLSRLQEMVPDQFDMVVSPVATFSPEYMAAQPEEAKALGCEPDFNAYTGEANPAPDASNLMRTAAGHIHIGWKEDGDPWEASHMEDCMKIVRALDCVLGAPAVLIERPNERRQLYGKAGAFRPKPYGVEYRVLSNFWVVNNEYINWVYSGVERVVRGMEAGRDLSAKLQRFMEEKDSARIAIDTENIDMASSIRNALQIRMPR